MKTIIAIVASTLLTAAVPPSASRTYTGIITDTMCLLNHASMKNPPEDKCVRECVGDGSKYKYALVVGDQVYTLSDQETPAKFAAQRVEITGVLYPKTKILKVEKIQKASGR